NIGPVSPESIVGVHIPIDTATAFVINPLLTLPNDASLDAAISSFDSASASQQASWAGPYGPVGLMISQLLAMARSGALDGALLSSPQLYGTNYTKPLLFIADGGYMASLADADHLTGDQWGMMNETGSFPGQAWLWL